MSSVKDPCRIRMLSAIAAIALTWDVSSAADAPAPAATPARTQQLTRSLTDRITQVKPREPDQLYQVSNGGLVLPAAVRKAQDGASKRDGR